MTNKKYILKPGKHQFAPKSPPVHDNDNLTDEEAEWYLKRYPHIAELFVEKLESSKVEKLYDMPGRISENQIIEASETPSENNIPTFQPSNITKNEDLSTTN